jgi:hypothetical protein
VVFWDAWKAYAHRASGYQTRVLLAVVYWVVLGPGALIARLFSARLLDLSPRPGESSWLAREPGEPTLEALRRQF